MLESDPRSDRELEEEARRRAGALVTTSFAALVSFLALGCLQAPVVPPLGLVYSNTATPLGLDFETTDLGERRGTASSHAVLGLVAWGDASVATAASEGGIGVVKHADYEYFNILGIYQCFTTIAHGD